MKTGPRHPSVRRWSGIQPCSDSTRLYPNLPGMGASPAPASMSSSDDMLQAVDDFVRTEIGSERFLLVDESFGGSSRGR